jgi:hypothetical protein
MKNSGSAERFTQVGGKEQEVFSLKFSERFTVQSSRFRVGKTEDGGRPTDDSQKNRRWLIKQRTENTRLREDYGAAELAQGQSNATLWIL